jgi:Tfp pilus assembly protein PilF
LEKPGLKDKGVLMQDSLRKEIYNTLRLRETEDLLDIWQKRDLDEWQPEVFDIIQQILFERVGSAPPQLMTAERFQTADQAETIQNQIEKASLRQQAAQRINQAETYLQTGALDRALEECETTIQLAPDLAEAYVCRGLVYDEMDQVEKALADYQKALQLDPDLRDAWECLRSAEKDIEEAFRHSPARCHLDLAYEYALNEETERALQECELAKDAMPGIAAAHNCLGLIYEELREFELAIESYLKAVQANPRFYAARENLANARVKLEEEQYRRVALQDGNGEEGDWEFPGIDEMGEENLYEYTDPIPGWTYINEKNLILKGWPSHRHLPGKSGLDPIDTYCEEGHIEGVMVHLLLNCRLRTHHPVFLLFMAVVGSVCCLPLLFSVLLLSLFDFWTVVILLFFSPYWILGIAVLRNVVSSLFTEMPDENRENGSAFF